MGANAPAPRLLRLKPEDMAKVGGAPLRTGRFTWVTEAGRQERWIVASLGSYTVLWNFRWVGSGCRLPLWLLRHQTATCRPAVWGSQLCWAEVAQQEVHKVQARHDARKTCLTFCLIRTC